MYQIKDLPQLSAIELGAFLVYLNGEGKEDTQLYKEALKLAEARGIVADVRE